MLALAVACADRCVELGAQADRVLVCSATSSTSVSGSVIPQRAS
jgi:hypothetical protein